MKLEILFAAKLYIKTFKTLAIGTIFKKFANPGSIDFKTLRKFEKLSCKIATLKMDLKFFNRCEDLGIIPEFLKFKPPRIEAYKKCKWVLQKSPTRTKR